MEPQLESHFSSIEDLEPTLREGVKITFKFIASMGRVSLVKPGSIWQGLPYAHGIDINPTIIEPKSSSPRIYPKVSNLDEQKITLLHEFDHLFREDRRGIKDGYRTSDHPLEIEIDKHCFDLLKNKPEVLESLVYELSTRPNCWISYKSGTQIPPFYYFHRRLVRKFLKDGSLKPEFGNLAQNRMFSFINKSITGKPRR